MSGSRTLRLLALLGLLAVAITAGWMWYRNAFLSGPLEGTTRHNFGEILLTENPMTVQHLFALRNRESHAIDLQAAKSNCGCVTIEVQPQTIEPGEAIELPLTMRVHPGTTKVQIQLALGDAGTQSLWVQATGKLPSLLSVNPPQIWLESKGDEGLGTATLTLTASIFDSHKPPARPHVNGLQEAVVDIGEWRLLWQPRSSGAPTQWQCAVTIRSDDPSALVGAAFEIVVDGVAAVKVGVISKEEAAAARPGPRRMDESPPPADVPVAP